MGATMLSQTGNVREIAGHSGPQSGAKPHKSALRRWAALAVVSLAVAAVLPYGMWSRVKANKKLGAETSPLAVTKISVLSPKQTTPAQELTRAGNRHPFLR